MVVSLCPCTVLVVGVGSCNNNSSSFLMQNVRGTVLKKINQAMRDNLFLP
jgi:hypothetical protein